MLGRGFDNADIGLVRYQPVHAILRHAGFCQGFFGDIGQRLYGKLEHGRAIHMQVRRAFHLAANDLGFGLENVAIAAVCGQLGVQNARLVGRAYYHGAGTVTKQHAGTAVVPVQQAAHDFGAHYQHVFGHAAFDVTVGRSQGVDKTGAHRLHIKCRYARDTQLFLQNTGGTGEHHVRRSGSDDDQVQIGGLQAGTFQGTLCREVGQVTGFLVFCRDVARTNASARDNPLVTGFDALSQHRIRHNSFRQVAAGTKNA